MASGSRSTQAMHDALLCVLRALVRVLLRHGVSFQTFEGLAKRAYVEVALGEFGVTGRKPSISRAAVLTGLTRKDIQRLLAAPQAHDVATDERYNRAARVVAGWVRDKAFNAPDGRPLPLRQDTGNKSFAELVRRYSGDMPTRAVLDELTRVGAAERMKDGRIRLLSRAYIPTASDIDKLQILGVDVGALIETIDHNLQHGESDPRFQRKVMYDNLPKEAIPRFREFSRQRSQALLEDFDRWLSRHDRDTNPAANGTGRMRAGVGIFYFEQTVDDEH
jgi:hypothetical protein